MSELEKLGMTDHASRKRSGFFVRAGLPAAVVLLAYVVLRNWVYYARGMLNPDFSAIHDAYRFNLIELPWTLAGVAALFALMGMTRPVIRKSSLALAGLVLFLAADLWALRYYVTRVEPERLVVRRVRLETPKLTAPVKVLHLTDIQAGEVTEYVRGIFEEAAALEPDLILYTGDFLQPVPPATFESEWPELHGLFESVNPSLGIYAAFGDTERELYSIRPEALEPIRMLSSRSVTIASEGGALSLHGLSLYNSKSPEWSLRTVKEWIGQTDDAAFRILFGHAPDFALGVRELPIDLCLAGHTHGGQVRLPWLGPLVIDSEVPKEWSRGFRRIGIPYLNVSAGAGSNRFEGLPPLRFNCPTEMTLIELVPARGIR
ncbi:MAG: metallophosphoesterase [Opitutales bacterium]